MYKWQAFILIGLFLAVILSACGGSDLSQAQDTAGQSRADLSAIKSYLLEKGEALEAGAAALQSAADRYYALAASGQFDYQAAWSAQPDEVAAVLGEAKDAWMQASPLYEQMEGIVAGVPGLSRYDVILDAGAAGDEDPENAVPFDIVLPDGRVLEKPGNLFGVLESSLWGTEPEYTIVEVVPDVNGNGVQDFGEALPDANVLKGAADLLAAYVAEMNAAAGDWQPTESDSFTALVVMIPTMNEYFNSWKNSRFVSGQGSSQRDFVAISRLADIQDILGSLQVVYQGVRPMVETVDEDQADHIGRSLSELKTFVQDIHNQERNGKRFSPEEADLLGAEAQNRATALAGQLAQIAAQLDIPIQE